MSEKNTPIDSAVPEFWKGERIPEATPRCLAGALLIEYTDVVMLLRLIDAHAVISPVSFILKDTQGRAQWGSLRWFIASSRHG